MKRNLVKKFFKSKNEGSIKKLGKTFIDEVQSSGGTADDAIIDFAILGVMGMMGINEEKALNLIRNSLKWFRK